MRATRHAGTTLTEPAFSSPRLCIFGARAARAQWLIDAVNAAHRARLVLFDASAQTSTDTAADRFTPAAGDDAVPVLRAAAAAFPGDDLILLRADTRLPPFWYERLIRAAQARDVLVATPLDDLDPARAPLPPGMQSVADAEQIDALCYSYGRRQLLDWPTFSPLLSAWCGAHLRAIESVQIQKYTLPQTLAPLRAVLIDHLYVASPDTVSIGLRGPAPVKPGDDPVPPSPLGELREGVAAALAAIETSGDAAKSTFTHAAAYCGLDGKAVVLHVLHGWGGGAERFVRDLATSDRARHHLVFIARGDFKRRRYGVVLELRDGALALPALRRVVLSDPIASTSFGNRGYAAFLDEILSEFAVDAIVVSSLIGHSLDALRTRLPSLYFVHDFYPLWPLLHRNLDDEATTFDDARLAADLAGADVGFEFAERDATYWIALREELATTLIDANAQLVAPSRAALTIFLRLQPGLRVLAQTVIAHGLSAWPQAPIKQPIVLAQPPLRSRLRLLVLGRVRRGKAAHMLRGLLPAIGEHAELFLLGAGPESEEFFGRSDVHIVLNYRRDELPQLLARIAPDAALILPDFAETFSYTLSELNSLGIPVIATRLGALAERIDDGVDGFLVVPTASAIIATIARLRRDPSVLAGARRVLAQKSLRTLDDFVNDYRDLLPSSARRSYSGPGDAGTDRIAAQTRAVELAEQQRAAISLQTKIATQQTELDRRADWGMSLHRDMRHARTVIDELNKTIESRTQWALTATQRESETQTALNALHDEFAERTRWALTLDTELQAMRGSLSWRMTGPLRHTMRKLRTVRAQLGYLLLRLRSALRRTRGSLAQRGVGGTLKRIGIEWERSRRGKPASMSIFAAPVAANAVFEPFAVPCSDTPRVSIVIPVHNKFEYTLACLRSLVEHNDGIDFETIVVDDASSDVTAKRLTQIDGIRAIRNEQNIGFIRSCNVGAKSAKGEFVLFLNNDTVVTAGWLAALLRCFADEPDAGLVGAKLIYPDGRLQEAGGIVFRDGSGWNYGRFDDPADPKYEFRREADYCSGAAIMLPRELFEQLDGFDVRYAPAYYEDTDLAFAVRATGKKVFYEPRAVVVHFEGVTSGTDTGSGIKQYQVINRDKFSDKWKSDLLRQPAPIDDQKMAPAAANFRERGHVLIVDAYTPTPDQDSGSLRMTNLMRLLRERGWQVSFLPDNRAQAQKYTYALQALGIEVLYHPFVSDPAAWLRANGSRLDAVILSRHYIAINYIGLVRLYAPRAKLIFDTVDLHYLREERTATLTGKTELAQQAARTKTQELKLMRECDITLVVSDVEKNLLAHEAPQARVEVLSNVHEIYGCRQPFGERRDLVFVGGFQHPPNIDAMLWFVHDVLPHLRAHAAPIHLHIIGSKVPASVLDLASDDVIVHGYVEDIAPFMDGCRVSVAPLRVGAGIKGKVNMAMSYGLPVVATSTAVEGMHVRAEENILVAHTAADFATAILRVYDDETLWNKVSKNGLDNVRKHFSFDAARKALDTILSG